MLPKYRREARKGSRAVRCRISILTREEVFAIFASSHMREMNLDKRLAAADANSASRPHQNNNNLSMWNEVKLTRQAVMPNGMQRKVAETYLVQAETCTDAENKVMDEVGGDIDVKCVRVSAIAAVKERKCNEPCVWYKVTTEFTLFKDCTPKKTRVCDLIYAENILRALQVNAEQIMYTAADYEVVKIEKTNIVDVVA